MAANGFDSSHVCYLWIRMYLVWIFSRKKRTENLGFINLLSLLILININMTELYWQRYIELTAL